MIMSTFGITVSVHIFRSEFEHCGIYVNHPVLFTYDMKVIKRCAGCIRICSASHPDGKKAVMAILNVYGVFNNM